MALNIALVLGILGCFGTNEAIVEVGAEAGWPAPASTQIHRMVNA